MDGAPQIAAIDEKKEWAAANMPAALCVLQVLLLVDVCLDVSSRHELQRNAQHYSARATGRTS